MSWIKKFKKLASLAIVLANAICVGHSADTLIIKVPSTDKDLFHFESPVQTIYTTTAPVLGQLLYPSHGYSLQPGLLKCFCWDGKTNSYLLTLRDDLVFHNGRKVEARDLEFSLLRGFYTTKPSFVESFFNNVLGIDAIKGTKKYRGGLVSGVQVVDKSSLKIVLTGPNPTLLHALTRLNFTLVPIEALQNDYETWKTVPIGAGPYKVVRYDAQKQELQIAKIDQTYIGPKEIRFTGSENREADIDISGQPQPGYVSHLSKRAVRLTGIYFNYNSPLGRDLAFRQSVNDALDRDELCRNIEAYHPAHEFLARHFYGRALITHQQDFVKASQTIAKITAFNSSMTYRIPVFNAGYGQELFGSYLNILVHQFKKIGLNVEFFESKTKFFDQNDISTPFRIISLGADITDPIALFGMLRGKASTLSPHFPVDDAEFEALYQRAKTAETFAERMKSLMRISDYIMKNQWMVPLFEKKAVVSYNPKRIESLGNQDGGLVFYPELVVIRKSGNG